MKNRKRVVIVFKLLMFLLSFVGFNSIVSIFCIKASASEVVERPRYSIELINNGTGVKITIEKSKWAQEYKVNITNTQNEYSRYMENNGKSVRTLGFIEKDGTKKRIYTIEGLPKGKYTFRIDGYKDDTEKGGTQGWYWSEEKTVSIKGFKTNQKKETIYDFSNVNVGDTIEFGTYEQDDNMINGKESLEWVVLSKDEKKIFVVSKYVIDCMSYNNGYVDTTWENSMLRKWLNEYLYKKAFSKSERKKIKKVKLVNPNNKEYDIEGGNSTKDRLFLLSSEDVTNTEFGFSEFSRNFDEARLATATAYAKAQGACYSQDVEVSWWWTRTPGVSQKNNTVVLTRGDLYNGYGCNLFGGIRPAMYISIK